MTSVRLELLLGNPATCPHGNPIPGSAGVEADLHALAESNAGDDVRLARVSETVEHEFDTLVYLDEFGFRPGASATVRAKAPDGTVTLEVDGTTLAIGPDLARQLLVAAR